jgi:hypothetical protein
MLRHGGHSGKRPTWGDTGRTIFNAIQSMKGPAPARTARPHLCSQHKARGGPATVGTGASQVGVLERLCAHTRVCAFDGAPPILLTVF